MMTAYINYNDTMINQANQFCVKAEALGISCTGLNFSRNIAGVSIYFDGLDSLGRTFKFRFSDHDCQRATGIYDKLSASTADAWLLKYEQNTYPERFEWEYLDQWINSPSKGRIQVRRLIGRK
jgi:hypothetical protein